MTNCAPVPALTKPAADRFDVAIAAAAVATSSPIAVAVAACFKVASATIVAVISPSTMDNVNTAALTTYTGMRTHHILQTEACDESHHKLEYNS